MTTVLNEKTVDMEPAITKMLNAASQLHDLPPYEVRSIDEVKTALEHFLKTDSSLHHPQVTHIQRLGGGASKEQFVFDLRQSRGPIQKYVLRMDPIESAIVTCRQREAAIIMLAQERLPAPKVVWADYSGEQLGRPAIITNFVSGVAKPSTGDSNISGFGTTFEAASRKRLGQLLTQHLATLHSIDWLETPVDVFQAPTDHPQQAALWQVNWWSRVWRDDRVMGNPLMALTERWLRKHLPTSTDQDLVFVHSDFRTGNFLYDESSLSITAILDWELAHIGDFHEDIAWMALKSWSTEENGTLLASGLLPLNTLCENYSHLSGRTINNSTLYFYQVLALYKCVAICLSTSVAAAQRQHNHQDIVLSWLATAGHSFLTDLHTLLQQVGKA